MADNHWNKILPKTQQAVWLNLQQDTQYFNMFKYYLAGGTALALHLGHRQSVDFDFFSQQQDIGSATHEWMQKYDEFILTDLDQHTVHGVLHKVKVSYIGAYKYPHIEQLSTIEGLPVASIGDIGAMKLLAITLRATVRDYIDIAAIIQNGVSLDRLFQLSQEKYGASFNPMVPIRTLSAYNNDDMNQEMPTILNTRLKDTWKNTLQEAIKKL